MSTYLESNRLYYQKNKSLILEKSKEARKLYKKTPRGKYDTHRQNAKKRKIPFLISFEEWWDLWQQSGKWPLRGKRSDQYQMCRYNDLGPYHKDNVYIASSFDNTKEHYLRNGIEHNRRFKTKSNTRDF